MAGHRNLQWLLVAALVAVMVTTAQGQVKRCYSCRSRGSRGDCRDPVGFNATHLVPGVEASPCASGWCSKIIEGKRDGKDHDLATERQCLQRSPPDGTQRCAEALVGKKKVFICFCQGDLCNGGPATWSWLPLTLLAPLAALVLTRCAPL